MMEWRMVVQSAAVMEHATAAAGIKPCPGSLNTGDAGSRPS
jgi:hypothetical protein